MSTEPARKHLAAWQGCSFTSRCKGKTVKTTLPLYFGITEQEFAPLKKKIESERAATKDKRKKEDDIIKRSFMTFLGKLPMPTEGSKDQQQLATSALEKAATPTHTIEKEKESAEKSIKVDEAKLKKSEKPVSPGIESKATTPTPTQASAPTSASPSTPASASTPASTPNPTLIESNKTADVLPDSSPESTLTSKEKEKSPAVSKSQASSPASSPVTAPSQTQTQTLSTAPAQTWAAMAASFKQPNKSKTTNGQLDSKTADHTQSSSAGTTATAADLSANEATSILSSKASSASASASAFKSTPVRDSITPNLFDNTVKPLGLVLLRLMFDSEYLSNAVKNEQNELVIPHGLLNTGNICYMNSIIQFLFSCEPFSQILNIIRKNSINKLGKSTTPILDALLILHESFKKPIKEESKESSVLDSSNFYNSVACLPRFSHLSWGRQEDAEEFLGYLLDGLHEEFVQEIAALPMADVKKFAEAFSNKETGRKLIKAVEFIRDESKESHNADSSAGWKEVANKKVAERRTMEVKYSPIVSLFGGQFKSVLNMTNKKSSITLDPFMQVQLDISDSWVDDLVSAFKKFSEDEEISMGKDKAKKQNFIDKVPEILIIQLKRFSFVTSDSNDDQNDFNEVVKGKKKKNDSFRQQQQQSIPKAVEGRIEKIHKFVKYEHQLELPSECISKTNFCDTKYELISVVYHHGRHTEGGHYTVDVKCPNDEWIRIDDTNITSITPDDAVSDQNKQNKTAYILMYKKIEN
ncbi:mRNA-binding ubiquitin-specific protease [Martiniozyma asiatica (nom. inval.)]|nr:mRNA-binding ubiquitin-specific protease [Martiniozyma asiatica]